MIRERLRKLWQWVAALPPRTLLVAGWVVFVLGCYPGYMSVISAFQLAEVRSHVYTDAHPPVMTLIWGIAEYVASGPLPMLALQSGLALFGIAAILRTWLSPRAAAVTAVAIVVFPPVFAPLAVIWPEPLLTATLLAATGAALQGTRGWTIAAAIALVVACACSAEAVFAILPIVALAVPPQRWWKRAAIVVAIAAALGGAARLASYALIDKPAYDDQRLMLIDVVGTLRRAGVSDPAALAGLDLVDPARAHDELAAGHDVYDWWSLAHGDHRLIDPIATDAQDDALHDAWRRTVSDHVGAYLLHRWQLLREQLATGKHWSPIYDDFGDHDLLANLHHRATASDWQVGMRAIVRAVGATPLFRPWLYVLLAIAGLVIARRDRVLRALLVSGLVAELATLPFATSPEYRYSHWLVTATCVAIAALAVARRAAWRAVTAAR